MLLLVVAVLSSALGFSGCATSGAGADISSSDGFWARGREANFKTAYGLDFALPVSEAKFLEVVRHTGLQVSRVGEPGSDDPVISCPRLNPGLDCSTVSHGWWVVAGYHRGPTPFHEKYLAYVVDGQVVSVENRFGYYD